MNKCILVVDDNADDVTLALEAFRKNKVANPVMVLRDGKQALDYLFGTGAEPGALPPSPPALILLDLKLPGLGGLEVLRRMRNHPRTRMLPVVIFTASRERQDLYDSYQCGANGYVYKPVEFSECTFVIGRLAEYWLKYNVQPPWNAV
jgi:two-component system response regulator